MQVCSLLTIYLFGKLVVCAGPQDDTVNLTVPPVISDDSVESSKPGLPRKEGSTWPGFGSLNMAQDHLAQGANDEKPVESPDSPSG